jgi:hypothetical protein
VGSIQQAVTAYYSQFEEPAAAGEAELPSAEPAAAEFEGADAAELALEPGSEPAEPGDIDQAPESAGAAESHDEPVEERLEAGSGQAEAAGAEPLQDEAGMPSPESDTIESSGPSSPDKDERPE